MSTDLLFEQFSTLATAPNGVARLRELILQLAVQGKLRTQDAGDEPASVSVDTFFRKNKQIKKKHFVNIDENLHLPEGWISITLGNIGQWALGTGFPISLQGHMDKPILFCKVSDMNLPGNEKWIKTTIHTIGEDIKNQYNIKTHSEGTIIFPKIGGAIATNKRRIITRTTAIDNNCLGITPNDFCSTDWLFLILTSIDFSRYQSGTSVPALNQGTLAEIVTNLPPLPEQHRIVAKVDRLMALCDELEARQQREWGGCLKLGTASLAGLQNATHPEEFGRQWAQVCDAFDLILDCPENVAVLRQTILQLAVQGHLTGSWRGDKIPEGWKYVNLDDTATSRLGKMLDKAKNQGIATPYLRNSNVRWFDFDLSDVKIIHVSESERNALYLQHGDVLICEGGEPGRTAIWKGPENKYIFQKAIHRVKVGKNLLPEWLCFCLKDAANSGRLSDLFTGSTIKHLTGVSLSQFQFLLPPLAEQHRIVPKVDALMAICDILEARLKDRSNIQGKYANAVVNQVAG